MSNLLRDMNFAWLETTRGKDAPVIEMGSKAFGIYEKIWEEKGEGDLHYKKCEVRASDIDPDLIIFRNEKLKLLKEVRV